MNRLMLLAAGLLAAACLPASAAEPLKLGCDGPIARDATRSSLAKQFGAKNVTEEDIDGVEGETIKATVINAKDVANRIEIYWHDEKKRARPATIKLNEDSTATIEGLKVMMGLKAVEEINGKPFSLNGFGWDMGGNAVDWKGGKLGKVVDGCSVSVQFAPPGTASDKAIGKVSGDKVFSSSDKAMIAVAPVVESLSYGWADR